jgi:Cof subfamily protein (haloacid dehalogenase superfamily)
MKTLFISDLDGTLFGDDAELSEYTVDTLNKLIDDGLHFTVATARSPWSIVKLKRLKLKLPAVLMNGVCVFDIENSKFLHVEAIDNSLFCRLLPIIHEYDLSGFLYMIKDNILEVFYENIHTPNAKAFMQERQTLFGKRFTRAYPYTEYGFSGMMPVYYSVCDRSEVLEPFYNRVKEFEGLRVEFYRDNYNPGLFFMEILAKKASKAYSVDYLKKAYGFDRVVVFGDNLNDLPMFSGADYSLAVANAHESAKNAADEIIKSNAENGVAEWLLENYKRFSC